MRQAAASQVLPHVVVAPVSYSFRSGAGHRPLARKSRAAPPRTSRPGAAWKNRRNDPDLGASWGGALLAMCEDDSVGIHRLACGGLGGLATMRRPRHGRRSRPASGGPWALSDGGPPPTRLCHCCQTAATALPAARRPRARGTSSTDPPAAALVGAGARRESASLAYFSRQSNLRWPPHVTQNHRTVVDAAET